MTSRHNFTITCTGLYFFDGEAAIHCHRHQSRSTMDPTLMWRYRTWLSQSLRSWMYWPTLTRVKLPVLMKSRQGFWRRQYIRSLHPYANYSASLSDWAPFPWTGNWPTWSLYSRRIIKNMPRITGQSRYCTWFPRWWNAACSIQSKTACSVWSIAHNTVS